MRRLGYLVSCLLVLGCSESKQEPKKTLIIGAIYDDTGANANFYWEQARAMAVSQMNEALDKSASGKNLRFALESRGHQNNKDAGVYAQTLARELAALGARTLFTDISGASAMVNGLNYDATAPLAVPVVCSPCTGDAFGNPVATNAVPAMQDGYRDLGNWLRRTSIVASPQMAYQIQEMLKRSPNGLNDGDLNGDGITKLAIYVATGAGGDANYNSFVKAATKLYPGTADKLVFDRVSGPLETMNPAEYTLFDSDLAKLADNHNDVTGLDDGYPDFIVVYSFPASAAAIAKAYAMANLSPRPVMVHSASSMRAVFLQAIGDYANGMEGIGNEVFAANASGTNFAADLTALTGAPPAGYDSNVYDAVVTAMLGVLKAALPLADPTLVTTEQVRVALDNINVSGADIVGTGSAEFMKAIDAIGTGKDINYDGASGPCDFDAVGDVNGNVAVWQVVNQTFQTKHLWDCLHRAGDWTTCPMVQ